MLKYLPAIDGLRALAVSAVVLYHLHGGGIAGGYLGVDLFFAISGFLITGLLCLEIEASGRVDFVGFYERRVRRLLPALLVVILVTLALGAVFLVPVGGEQQGLAWSALAALVFVANLYFREVTGGYFDEPAETLPLLHTWSLAVEEQFYLGWPLVLLLAYGGRRFLGAHAVWLGLLLVGLVSLFAFASWQVSDAEAAFYLTPARAWQFAAGGLCWMAARRLRASGAALAVVAASALLALIAAFALAGPGSTWGHYVVTAAAGALLWSAASDRSGLAGRALASAPLVWLGQRSYGFYLWHWPLLAVARADTLGELSLIEGAALVGLALLAAQVSYVHLEQPIRKRQLPVLASRPRLFGTALGVGTLTAVAALGLGAHAKWIGAAQGARPEVARALQEMRKVRTPCGAERPYAGRLPEGEGCVRGAGPAMLWVWGDSHAAHLLPAVDAFSARLGIAARIRYMPECPPALGFDPALAGVRPETGCTAFNADVLDEIRAQASDGTRPAVILNARWFGYGGRPEVRPALIEGVRRTVIDLEQVGARVMLMLPSVDLAHPAPLCLARRAAESCDRTMQEQQALLGELSRALAAAVAEHPAVRAFDPVPELCPDGHCPAYAEGVVIYSDSHHWTEATARRMAKPMQPLIDWMLAAKAGEAPTLAIPVAEIAH